MSDFNFIADLKTKVYCRLGVSKIHGVGVFAIRAIPTGVNPFEETRPVEFIEVPIKDVIEAELSPEQMKLVKDLCPEREEDGVFDVPNVSLNEVGVAWYLNHSDLPNMIEDDGLFFAARDIAVGEELTVNYGTYGALNL